MFLLRAGSSYEQEVSGSNTFVQKFQIFATTNLLKILVVDIKRHSCVLRIQAGTEIRRGWYVAQEYCQQQKKYLLHALVCYTSLKGEQTSLNICRPTTWSTIAQVSPPGD